MQISRRSFIRASSSVLALSALSSTGCAAKTPPLVGSQLFGWGQYYSREGKKLDEHLGEVLSALRDAGYDYAEHNMGAPDASAKFAEQLRGKGMKPVSLYTGGAYHDAATAEKNVAALVKNARGARDAGFTIINSNPAPIGRAKTDEELATQAKWLGIFGGELTKLGMKFGVHNHTPEMADGAKEFHANFQKTDPRDVGFCYDVHWVFRGGVMPADALAAYGSRIVSWHLRQSRDKIWWEDLDAGDLDYTAVAKYAAEHEIPPFYTVELAIEGGTKITRSVVENHARSRDFVRAVFRA